jgi:D-beta-D-heptose 7-phosphate kinase/D-beta-D-heptose 1-phosphate adenosyltransferase
MKKINKIISLKSAVRFCKQARRQKKKIIFTNGCFDLLHPGHVYLLETAKSLGRVLIVGLNSDSSIRRIKGKNRPINNQNDRAAVLQGIESVDKIIIFKEDTPYNLIKAIKPDVLVKGSDYRDAEIIGREFAGKTIRVRQLKGKSTTNLIKKLSNYA